MNPLPFPIEEKGESHGSYLKRHCGRHCTVAVIGICRRPTDSSTEFGYIEAHLTWELNELLAFSLA